MPRVRHRSSVRVRAAAAVAAGTAVGIAVGPALGVAGALLSAWAVACLVSVVWVLLVVWPMDAAATRAHATAEDPGRAAARLIAVTGSLASLAAVAVVLTQGRGAGPAVAAVYAGIAVLSTVGSWALIQLDYMLRVAHRYYREPVGGISFNQSEDPQYSDFVYFAVGLAMTYQVADTNLQTNELRRIVVAQTLLAYLFGAVFLATLINLVSGLG